MKVIINVQIRGAFACASSSDIYLYKEFSLPFAPFPGLYIQHKTAKDETDDLEIKGVAWDADEQAFICYVASDKEIYNAIFRHQLHRPIKEIVEEYLETDWLLDEQNQQRFDSAG
jgi:hypothetical protein